MMLLDELGGDLQAAGIGTRAVDLFESRMPEAPDVCGASQGMGLAIAEALALPHLLHDQDDGSGPLVLHQELQAVGERDPGLVPRGDHVPHAEQAVLNAVQQ